MEVAKPIVFGECLNNRQGLPIVQSYITHIRQHQMVSYENKQTPFKNRKEERKWKREREKESERGREGKKLIIDENRKGTRKRVKVVRISSLHALSLSFSFPSSQSSKFLRVVALFPFSHTLICAITIRVIVLLLY